MANNDNKEYPKKIVVNGDEYTVDSMKEEDLLRKEVKETNGAEINEQPPITPQDAGNQMSSTDSATVEQDPQAQSIEADQSQKPPKNNLDLSLENGSLESKIANGTATEEETSDWINNYVKDLHRRPLTGEDGQLPPDGGFFEDMWSVVQQGISTGTSVNEGFDIFSKGAKATDEEIQGWIDASMKIQDMVQTHEQVAFQKSQEKNGGGIKGTLKSLYENPGFLPQMIATSMATMVTSLESEEVVASATATAGAGAAATWYTGYGAIIGTMSGATMGLTGAMETSLTLSELLGEELENMGLESKEWNTANIRTLLEDEDVIERMKSKALGRGIAIGAFEGLTMGLSRGVGGQLLKIGAGGKTITAATGILEASGGSGGEALGQFVAGGIGEGEDGGFDIEKGRENMDAAEILLEGIAELKGVVNTADIAAQANSVVANTTGVNVGEQINQMVNKSEYTVNGESTTKSEIDNIINSENIDAEDLANIKIEIKNDDNFNNKVKEKQNDAIIETQISEKVVSIDDRKKLVQLEKQKIKAQSDIQKEGSARVPGAEEKLNDVNNQINEIIDKHKDVDVNSQEVIDQKKKAKRVRNIVRDRSLEKTIQFAKDQGKLLSKETVVVENNTEAQSMYEKAVDEYNSKNPDKQVQKQNVKDADGFIVGDTIFINKDIAGKTGAISVGSHEVLHGVLEKHMQSLSPNSKRKLITDFKNVLTSEQKTAIETRLKENYSDVKDFDINTTDEWFTGFSDAIERGDITFNESTFDKVKNLIQEIARKFGIKKDFANGRQAYNFLKDYSRSITKNKLSARAMKLAAEGKQVKNNFKPKASRSTVDLDVGRGDLSTRIDSYTKEAKTKDEFQKPGGGFDDVYSGILEGKFDRVLGEGLSTDQRDIMRQELADRLINYDPTKTPELSKWMYGGSGKGGNIQFANLEAKKKLFEEGEKRKKEVRGDVIQEGTGRTIFESITDTQTELTETEISNQKKYSKLRRDLGLDKKMMDKVKDVVITTFGTNLPNVDSKKFRDALEKNFRTMLKKPIQDLIGSRDNYNNFLTKNFEAVFNALPVETLVQMERSVSSENRIFTTSQRITKPTEVDVLISKGKLPKDTNRTSGPQLHTKNKYPGQNKIMSYFRGVDMKNQLGYEVGSSTLGTRKDKLAMEIGVELGFDATMEVVQTKEVAEKRSSILELQGKEQLGNETAVIAKQIDRDPTVKFSKSMENAKKDNDLNNLDLSKIFKENSIGWIEANFPTIHDALSIMFDNKYSPTTYENKGFLNMIGEADPNLAKLAKEKVHQTVKTKTVDGKKVKLFDKKKLKDHESNYVLPLLDFIPPFMGKRDLSQKNGNNRFLENTILKATSDRGNVGDGTVKSRKNSRKKFRNKLNDDMGKNLTPETKKLWNDFKEVQDKLQLAESTFDMPETLLRKIREIQASNTTAKQKVKEAQKLFDYGSLDAAQKLYKAINSSTQDWVNNQVESGKMTREEAIAYVIRDKQKNTNFTKGERALAAFTSSQFSDGPQVVSKKDYKGEHVKDSATVSAQSVVSIYNNTFNQDADAILSGYEQSYIPKKWANEMDKLGGANSPLKNRRFILNPEIGKNVYDLKTGKSMYELELSKFSLEQSKVLEQSHNNSTRIKSAQNAIETKKKYEKDGKKKGMSTFDFDETLIIDGKNFVVATNPITGEKTKISSANWPTKGTKLAEQGFEMNFDDFVNVRGGIKGPLFQKLKNRIDKFGIENNFILTARPQESAIAIHGWLKSKGINIPLKNITGLGDSKADSKAQWMMDKFAEGYNDMYFVDDALPNVEAVKGIMDQLDVKGSSVQAKTKVMVGPYLVDTTTEKGRSFINDWNKNPDIRSNEFKTSEDWIVDTRTKDGKNKIKEIGVSFSKSPTVEFNEMLERKFKVGKEKVFSTAEARTRGEKKGKNILKNFFIPPSAEDFKGLLYGFLGKGKQGDADLIFFKNKLLTPFAEGVRNWNTFKQNMSDQYIKLKDTHKDATKSLNKKVPDTNFTNDTAIRVYLWDKNKMDIPGIAESTKKKLVDHVKNNPELTSFADVLGNISNAKDGYVSPGQNWMVESIASDLNNAVNNVGRSQFLSDFIDNKNEIFSQDNLNKIEAIKGIGFRDALENMLYRMETGNNRITGKDKNVNGFLDWVNGSVGAVMFMNIRSAALQTMSTVNFINWGDNNIFKASKAFANQPQFWKDFSTIFNSDMLKQRRAGLAIDVSASELTKTFSEGGKSMTDKSKSVIRYLLEKGFAPTRAADSFAIAMGGASFYRNRLDTYIKQGMSEADAQKKAFLDFQEVAEETQQSSRPDLISMQQAGTLGRIILAWQNTPMQMTRLTKKALSDIVNRRGDMKTNISKVMYYGAVQNLIFGALQSGLAFMLFGSDEDEEKKKNKEKRILNGALDSLLRGTGVYGAAVATLKNTILKWQEERKKNFAQRDDAKIILEAINLSPPIGSKLRKINSAIKTDRYNKGVSDKLKFRIENPKLSIAANSIEAATNIPIARLVNKANNVEEALTGNHEMWKRVALIGGWNKWDIGVKDEELEQAKQEAKQERKEKKKIEKEQKKLEEQKAEEERKKKEGIKTVRCSGTRSNGQPCSLTTETKAKTWLCQHHRSYAPNEKTDRDGDGIKEVQCSMVKSNGKRCKNRTENKNGKCYAHQ